MRVIETVAHVATAVGVIAAVVGLAFTYASMAESRRLAWLSSLEQRGMDFYKIEIEREEASCIYDRTEIPGGNEHCFKVITSSVRNFIGAIDYASESVQFLCEMEEYSGEYLNRWHLDWKEDLSDDPHGVVVWGLRSLDLPHCSVASEIGESVENADEKIARLKAAMENLRQKNNGRNKRQSKG